MAEYQCDQSEYQSRLIRTSDILVINMVNEIDDIVDTQSQQISRKGNAYQWMSQSKATINRQLIDYQQFNLPKNNYHDDNDDDKPLRCQ